MAGGLQETPDWNNDWHGVNRSGLEYGTDDAWVTPDFLTYFSSRPDVEVRPLGTMNAGNNNIPGAALGDVILYDWDGQGEVDHAAMIVGFDGEYPLVAGWSENGSSALTYPRRGWTWSEQHDTWLQDRPGYENMTATIIHVRTEDEALEGI